MGKVIVIASGKGGTGKSVFTANLGATLALRGYSVALIDMDMGVRNLDLYLGLENNVVYDVSDVVSGVCRIKQALIRDKRFDSLCLMPSPPHRDDGNITPLHMQVLCEKLKGSFDYVLIDSPSGIDDGFVLAAAGADSAVIVTAPEYAALRDADMVNTALAQLGIEERGYVVNKVIGEVMSAGLVPNINEITEIIKSELYGFIQYDENIMIAANNGVPIVCKPDSYITENFSNIADRILYTGRNNE
jgi:septum site-determining protein MinD